MENVYTAGVGGRISSLVGKVKSLPQDVKNLTWKDVKPIQRIKGLHGPITYLVLAVVMAQKYKSLWKNPAWRRLHQLAYPAAVLGAVHYVMLVKGWQLRPLIFLAIILVLLLLRVRKSRQKVRV